ncbi:MAG TPA: hypothetical protein VEH04_01250 [Verrucomicrobiae bacterium]|nr:hypothetical protein [Verrucomicrobiae bacterium]
MVEYERHTRLLRNDGGQFTDAKVRLESVYGRGVFADFDCDGRLDIITAGLSSNYEPTILVYRNIGAEGFAQLSTSLPGLAYAMAGGQRRYWGY